jgi:hypothetical protein
MTMHRSLKNGMHALLASLALSACATAGAAGGAVAQDDGLRAYVQSLGKDVATRYVTAGYDLDGDGTQEALLYLQGPAWCGSGGCTLRVLQRHGKAWNVRASISVARLPVSVLPETSHGWHDLAVRVQGGGIAAPRASLLRYDGTRYPGNPTTAPAELRDPASPSGEVVLQESAVKQSAW